MNKCIFVCACLSLCVLPAGKTSCAEGSEPQEDQRDQRCLPDSTGQPRTLLPRYQLPPLFLIVTFVLHTVYRVLMRSGIMYGFFFFLCKSSTIRRNYGTLSLALENLQWTNRYHQPVFKPFWLKWKRSEFHTVNPRLQPPYRWAFRPGSLQQCLPQLKLPLRSHDRSTPAFHHDSSGLLLAEAESPLPYPPLPTPTHFYFFI